MADSGDTPDLPKIRDELRQIIIQAFGDGLPALPDDVPILDLGLGSLVLVDGLRRVNEHFGVVLSMRRVIEDQITFGSLPHYIYEELSSLGARPKNSRPVLPDWTSTPQFTVAREIPVAASQQHLAFLSRYSDAARAAFNVPLAVRLAGRLDRTALQSSIQRVGARFEALRTVLSPENETFIITAGSTLGLATSDSTRENRDEWLKDIVARPFEIGKRLFRAGLLRLGDQEHILVLVGHGLVMDHAALTLVLEDMAELYGQVAHPRIAAASTPVIQWTDYVALAATPENEAARRRAESYWKQIHAPGLPLMELPADRPRPAAKEYSGDRVSLQLEPEQERRLRAGSARLAMSLDVVLMAAFSAFLHRLCDQTELVIGVESGPLYPELEARPVAPSHQMLPVRSRFNPGARFDEFLRSQAERLVDANAHRHVSLAELIPLLKSPRDQGRSPLFTVAFRVHEQAEPAKLDGLQSTYLALPTAGALYDLELTVVDSGGGIQLLCDYSTELFEKQTISGWLQGLVDLLDAGLRDPGLPCNSLPAPAAVRHPASSLDAMLAPPGREPGEAPIEPPATPTEQSLAKIWAGLLGMDAVTIGRDSNFMDLGGDSLLITRLIFAVRKTFQVDLAIRELFAAPTLRKFAAHIDASLPKPAEQKHSRRDASLKHEPGWARQRMAFLQREAELPRYIRPGRGMTYKPVAEARTIFLTGATGFLGTHLVAELLRATQAEVYCLVRPTRGESGRQRIESKLRRYDLWDSERAGRPAWESRLHVIEGDITLPRLGLPDPEYERLAQDTDAIFHSAAHVNFIYPYEALRATNVAGLHEIIQFAFHGRIKPIHHLSTAAIWPIGERRTFYESDSIEHGGVLNLGYDEAKWVNERSLLHAAERGLPVTRYRPGEVGGDSRTGLCDTQHFILSCFKGFLEFGAFPALELEVNVAPVDYVAKAMVYLALFKQPVGRAFHLTNPYHRPLSDALRYLRDVGYQFEELPFDELRERLLRSPSFGTNALFPYQAALEDMDSPNKRFPTFDTRETLRELEGSGITCPPADETLFDTYRHYLLRIGFLAEPANLPASA